MKARGDHDHQPWSLGVRLKRARGDHDLSPSHLYMWRSEGQYRIPHHFQMGRKETRSMHMATATISNSWERGWGWRKVVMVIVAHPVWKRRGRLRKRTGGGKGMVMATRTSMIDGAR